MTKIDGVLLKQMIISGSNNLFNHYPEVDSLNVFPVPDGDTGTNMNLTASSGVKEIANKYDEDIYEIAKAFSRGLLMGARGNSGVILSQIFRGFAQGLKGKTEIDAVGLAEALEMGKNVAYKAVMRPVEGTILTVMRESSEAFSNYAEPGMKMNEAMEYIYNEACSSLERTPDLLPVLKEVGVVDSGGSGLVYIFEGFVRALNNDIVEKNMPDVTEAPAERGTFKQVGGPKTDEELESGEKKEFGYCTEFILRLAPKDKEEEVGKRIFSESKFKAILDSHGDSIVEVKDNDLLKVHIHTKHPGNILSFAQQYGEFVKIKVENMTEQHSNLVAEENTKTTVKKEEKKEDKTPKKYAMIACCSGSGIADIFRSQRVDYIVEGGQTMNPSTEDFIKQINNINAENIFIFPNNSNIIMAAKQAGQVIKDKNVVVIPSTSIPQGIVSSMMFNPEVDVEENKENMEDALGNVSTGQVTFAIRDTTIDGVEVKKDQFMGIIDKKIKLCEPDKFKAARKVIKEMTDEMTSIITIIFGEDITKEEQKSFKEFIDAKYGEDIDIDYKEGKQPVYSFIIGVE
ncbi:MAG: DAK2 domain-containing protein [Bacilli bacterium]